MSILALLVVLSACATDKKADKAVPIPPPPMTTPASAPLPEPVVSASTPAAAPQPVSPPARPSRPKSIDVPSLSMKESGGGGQARQANSGHQGSSEKPYQIQVENMPLNEFIYLVFGKILETSYSVDKSVEARKETVTLNMKVPARQSEVIEIVKEIFRGYGLGIETKEGITFIVPISGQPQKPVVPYFLGSIPETVPAGELVGLMVQVYHLKPMDFGGIVQTLALSNQGRIVPIPGTSMVSIIDDANHARAAAELLGALDRPSLVNKKIKLFYLTHLSLETFTGYLTQSLPAQGIPVAKNPADPGLILVPMSQIRAVLAVSPKQEWLNIVGFWQEKLDLPSISEDEPQFYIYHPKNRRASDLAKLFGGGSGPRTRDKQTSKMGSKQQTSQEAASQGWTMEPQQGKNVQGEHEPKAPRPVTSLGDVAVTVDDDSNSLVITATPFQYAKIEEILTRLDRLPRQVLVEVTIGEVTLTGKLNYGIEWAIRHSDPVGTLGTLGKLGLGTTGFVYTVGTAANHIQAALNAFAQDGALRVLSTPRLVVLDNQEASINVGQEVPIVTSEASAGLQQEGNTSLLRSIQYRKTGVILTIKPTINSQGMLTLVLRQEVSNAQTNDLNPRIGSPIISTRNVETSVALKSGSSVLLGGLIKNSLNSTVNKVPAMSDIPLLGVFFRNTTNSTERTELFIQITPHILTNAEEAEDVTRNFKDILKMFK